MIIGRLVILDDNSTAEVLDSWCDCGDWWLGVALQDGRLRSVHAVTVVLVVKPEIPS